LLDYFPLTVFGDSFSKREQIVNKGLEEAAWVYGLVREDINLVTIGDAPADIQAGKTYHARTISVCTGDHTASQLQVFQPDYIFSNLQDTVALFNTITKA
jgi:phosphoglycolate phosphatase-like HAD superfamily hydrolase